MAGIITSVADAVMYVVLSEAKNHTYFGEVIGITGCMTLYRRCRVNRGRYNRVKLNADNGSLVMYGCMYCFRISEWP
jgi:hypothetical protein